MANASLLQQKVWLDKHIYDEAERVYYENLAQKGTNSYEPKSKSSSKPSEQSTIDPNVSNIEEKIKETESKIKNLVTEFQEIKDLVKKFHDRLQSVESFISKYPISQQHGVPQPSGSSHQPSTSQNKNDDDDADDGVDLFGSDSEDEDEEAKKIKEQRLAMYAEKKSKKPALIAKSNIILDVKPWDDETNMKELEKAVRSIQMDGLLWGASKLVPLAYGIHKLQISCVVEDDKVSVDLLQEAIEGFEDYVQSVDIAAFNKV